MSTPTTNPARRAGVLELYEQLQARRHICLAGANITVWNLAGVVQYHGDIADCDPAILNELIARRLVTSPSPLQRMAQAMGVELQAADTSDGV